MNYDIVRTLLKTQLLTVANLPALQDENTQIAPAKGALWSRLSLLTAEPNAISVGPNGLDEHQGLAQVDLFYPQGAGTSASNAMAAAVMAAFPRGFRVMSGVDNVLTRMVYQQTAYQAESWYVVPVVIRWSSFRTST